MFVGFNSSSFMRELPFRNFFLLYPLGPFCPSVKGSVAFAQLISQSQALPPTTTIQEEVFYCSGSEECF